MITSLLGLLLSTVKLWIRVFILVIISIALYGAFYQWYIPHFISTFPIFFQHDVACTQLGISLQAKVDNANHHQPTGRGKSLEEDCQFVNYDLHHQHNYYFQRGQMYNVELRLMMPDSYVNRNLGMFMVRLRLYNSEDKQLFNIARPALYPYQSMYMRIINLVSGTFLHMVGLFSESNLLKILLIDEHVHNIEALPFSEIDRIRVEIETYKAIEIVPPSHLYITARLKGIQYWMYFWPVTSFILITCAIFCLLFSVYLALIIRQLLNSPPAVRLAEPLVTSSNQGELPPPPPAVFEGLSGPALIAQLQQQVDFDRELKDD